MKKWEPKLKKKKRIYPDLLKKEYLIFKKEYTMI